MPSIGSSWNDLYEQRDEARKMADSLALALVAHFPEAGSALGGCGAFRDWLLRSWVDKDNV